MFVAQMSASESSTAIDFADHEITATVRRVSGYGNKGFVTVNLDSGRVAIGEIDDADGELTVGICYRWFGVWVHHDRYGDQFKFDSFTVADQQTQLGVVTYLARSDLGLSKADAARLWNQYGENAIAMLRDHPADVVADGVLSDKDDGRQAMTASAKLKLARQDEPTKIALFELFANRGFPRGTVRACIKQWGASAPKVIRRDPFQLIVSDIEGVGFIRADKLYLDLGGNPLRLKRQMLAAWHWLRTNGSGNTWEIDGGMHNAIMKATGTFDPVEFTKAIALGVRAGWISTRNDAAGSTFYADRETAAAEERLAKHIRRVLKHRTIWPEVTAEDLADDHQRAALASLRESSIAILAGTPGTGKTFTAAVLIKKLLQRLSSGQIVVCAPTGKAAVRITEALRRYNLSLTATTIHQALEVDGSTHGRFSFARNEENPLDAAVVIVDEGSMKDTNLAASLFAAVPPGGNVLIVGDPFQLPPVAHGAPLRDMIAAGITNALLTEIKRNAGRIVHACSEIKDGKRFACVPRADESAGLNLVNLAAASAIEQAQIVTSLVGALKLKGFNPIWDAQVLVAMNDRGEVSKRPLNRTLQAVLNPQDENVPSDRRNTLYRPGDKIICLKNSQVNLWERRDPDVVTSDVIEDYRSTEAMAYLANGDMGRVLAVDSKSIVAEFLMPSRIVKVQTRKSKKVATANGASGGDAESIEVGSDNTDFDLAYAITIHKSQGSEWPVVIVPLDADAGAIGCRELIYTAISRSARLCFLIGEMKTAWKWVAKANLGKRRTFLKELLLEGGA